MAALDAGVKPAPAPRKYSDRYKLAYIPLTLAFSLSEGEGNLKI